MSLEALLLVAVLVGVVAIAIMLGFFLVAYNRRTQIDEETQGAQTADLTVLRRQLEDLFGRLQAEGYGQGSDGHVLQGDFAHPQLTQAPHEQTMPSYGQFPDGVHYQQAGPAANGGGYGHPDGLDHLGARSQLAARAGRPDPAQFNGHQPGPGVPSGYKGYEVVAAGPQRNVLVDHARPLRPDDTGTMEPIGDEPPKFSSANFERRTGESDEQFATRIAALQEEYNAWLAEKRSQVTGGFMLPTPKWSSAQQ